MKSVELDRTHELHCRNMSESGHAHYTIYARGTGNNNLATRMLTINDVEIYNTSGRGMRLTVYDTSMNLQSDTVYDLHGIDADRTALADVLNALPDDRIFIMTSYDSIHSNSTLETAMNNLGTQQWYKVVADGFRMPYACVGIKRLGILSEQCWAAGVSDPYAEFTWTYEDYDSAGNVGYGPVIIQTVGEQSYTGTGYNFGTKGFDITDLKDTEYVRLTVDLKVDLERRLNGGYSSAYLYTRTVGDSWVRATSVSCNSTQWQTYSLVLNRDDVASIAQSSDGQPENLMYFSAYHYPSSNDFGTSYFRNMQIQRCGFDPNDVSIKSKISAQTVTSPDYVESVGSFSLYDPNTYYNIWASDKNLIRDDIISPYVTGTGAVDEDVYWFDRILTLNNQKNVMWKATDDTSGANMYRYPISKDIDSNKSYYCGIWMYNFEKTIGNNYLGCHGYNSIGEQIGVEYATSTSTTTNPYSWVRSASGLQHNDWYLIECWMLASWMTIEDGTAINALCNKGYDINHASGALTNFRLKPETTKARPRWLDYYNDSARSKTWWALPIMIEIDAMDILEDGKLITNKFMEDL